MCQINLSNRAKIELKNLGCNHKRFLRLGVNTHFENQNYTALIDCSINESDEILLDSNGIKVISYASNAPLLEGVTIDFDSEFIFHK